MTESENQRELVTQSNKSVERMTRSVRLSPRVPGQCLDAYERRRVRIRLFQWSQTKPERRIPATLKELAIELGVSRSCLTRLQRKLPQTKEEYIQDCELQALADYPDILDSMLTSAKGAGPVAAQDRRLLVTEVIKPLRFAADGNRKPSEGEQIMHDAISKMIERRKLNEQKQAQLQDGKTIEGENAASETIPTPDR